MDTSFGGDMIQPATHGHQDWIDILFLISKTGYKKIMKHIFKAPRGNGFEHKLSFKCEGKMKPYQTSTDSEHLPAFLFASGRINVFG